MTPATQQRLLDLKARQESGEHMPCPRCGRDTMKDNLHTNALSRIFDIMICDSCGLEEAMAAFAGRAMLVEDWACMKKE